MSRLWVDMHSLNRAIWLGEVNRLHTENSGLLRGEGIIRPEPHLGPHTAEVVGYLDWVDIDDLIKDWARMSAMRQACRKAGANGGKASKSSRGPAKKALVHRVQRRGRALIKAKSGDDK